MEKTISINTLFNRFAKPYRWQVTLASICSVFKKIFDVFPELLIGMAINVVVKQQHSFIAKFGIIEPFHQIIFLATLTLVVWVLEGLFQYWQSHLWRSFAQNIQHKIRVEGYAHLQRLDMGYYQNKNVGQLITVLNDDINQLERFVNRGINEMVQLVVGTLLIGGIFFYLAPQVAIFALLPIPIVFGVIFYFQRLLKPRYRRVRQQAGSLGARLATNILGILTIKSYTAERYELERLKRESEAYRGSQQRVINVVSLFLPVLGLVVAMSFIISLVLGGWYVLQGALDVGAYSILVYQTQRLLWPFRNVGKMMIMYQMVIASVSRIDEIMRTPIKIISGGKRLSRRKIKGEIKLKDVSFYYPGGMMGLSHATLEMRPGQTVAFVGATGSGKSTIVKLLLRFYDVSDGEITLDGTNINDIKLRDLRNAIGLVSQDVFLFPGTIRQNIAYGKRNANLNEIIKAAKAAEAHEFIMRLPEQYDTIIGEGGINLSGGQRQRISIARAILKNPPIFIFDEATSAVDNETEAAIQRSLEKIVKTHTTVVIAHRLSTVRNADIIFVVDRGKIVEVGTHAKLLKKEGIYHALWCVQTGAC